MTLLNRIKSLYHKAIAWTYTIGFVDYSESLVLDPDVMPDVHWVKGIPNGHWYADPFILSETEDSLIVLVEDYAFKGDKGQISKIKVDKRTFRITEIDTVLKLGTHLSFPAILYMDDESGKIFFYPENCKSGRLDLYEYDQHHSMFSRTLCPYPIADAVVFNVNDTKVIAGTLFPNDNGKELLIFPYFEDECPRDVKPLQTVKFSDNSARNAGMPFLIGNTLYRPAQNSNHRYGECVVIQRLDVNVGNQICFQEIKRIYSPSRRYSLTFHTFNVYKDKYVVVDASGYRFGLFGAFLEWFSNSVKKLMK